ncbi:MAG: ATP-binding protein [Pseudomonadota bacterium]
MAWAARRLFGSAFGKLGLAVGLALVLCLAALPTVERLFLIRAGEQGIATLRLTVEGLRGALQRFEPLPSLIGERPSLARFLTSPNDQGLQLDVNEELRLTAEAVGASDVYLLDTEGLTIASSNYLKERSFLGRRFAFRPYFTAAVAGGTGRYFALGTTSLERGYFYAAPVWRDGAVIGVLTLKFTVDGFESAWRGSASDVIVTDLVDIVFMSSREDWHFRTLSVLDDDALALVTETQQYPLEQLVPLPNSLSPLANGLDLMRVEEGGAASLYVTTSTLLEDVGWRVRILVPAGPAQTQALITITLVALLISFVGLIATVLLQRRARVIERLEAQRAAQDLLERRVAERTSDLNDANAQLRTEIDERKDAEDRLRKTQAELIQAGKLAALGQMSAALSHEINQPLAAVKSYADNAATFLDRERYGDVRDNVGRISKMADRMAAISSNLRNFARRPRESIRSVDVVRALDDALALLDARLKSTATDVTFQRPQDPVWVMGGQLRLQQVFVNLINNALDAMGGADNSSLSVTVEQRKDQRVHVTIADNGPGIGTDLQSQIFDPFFTTKDPGKGLGLGLSISYKIIEGFDGRLRAANRQSGGAVFTVDLQRADSPDVLTSPVGQAAE